MQVLHRLHANEDAADSNLMSRWVWLDDVVHLRRSLDNITDERLDSIQSWCRQVNQQIYQEDSSWLVGDPIAPHFERTATEGLRATLISAIPIFLREKQSRRSVTFGTTQIPLLQVISEPTGPRPKTIDERFRLFHAVNPHVYGALRDLALKVKRRGHATYGIGGLFEVLRWDHAMHTEGEPFKLCNDYRACYARLLMKNESELSNFFRLRRRTTEGASESPESNES